MSWLIVVVGLLAIFLFVKLMNRGQDVWSYFVVIIAIFFLLTLAYVSTQPGINLTTFDGWVELGRLYLNWLGRLGANAGKITGNAIQLDWKVGSNLSVPG